MSNTYFQFKQFRIEQDRCAMKVSTDACIQGAWTPVEHARSILDIGTGTGLLSLMLAQRQPEARITAIEREEAAAQQACENFVASPFAERIELFLGDALHWDNTKLLACNQRQQNSRTLPSSGQAPAGTFESEETERTQWDGKSPALRTPLSALSFDLIICNPPFFQNSLKGPDAARNAARHTDTLNPKSMAEIFQSHLMNEGIASIMFPPESYHFFRIEALMLGLKEESVLIVRDRAGSRITRMIGVWKKTSSSLKIVEEELLLKDANGKYSEAFVELMKAFYLHL